MADEGLTDEELAAIRERCEKATPGPWEWVDGEDTDRGPLRWVCASGTNCGVYLAETGPDGGDAEFIAHAREDVPALLAEVERLRTLLHEVADYEDDLTTGPWPRVWAEFGVHAPE